MRSSIRKASLAATLGLALAVVLGARLAGGDPPAGSASVPRFVETPSRETPGAEARSRSRANMWLPRFTFGIAGSPLGPLSPGGGAVPVDLRLSNPNPVSITVTSVQVAVTGSSSAGCDASDIVVVRHLLAEPVVPARQARTLSDLRVPISAWPVLRMIDRGNQDACRGAAVHLSFQGSATR